MNQVDKQPYNQKKKLSSISIQIHFCSWEIHAIFGQCLPYFWLALAVGIFQYSDHIFRLHWPMNLCDPCISFNSFSSTFFTDMKLCISFITIPFLCNSCMIPMIWYCDYPRLISGEKTDNTDEFSLSSSPFVSSPISVLTNFTWYDASSPRLVYYQSNE